MKDDKDFATRGEREDVPSRGYTISSHWVMDVYSGNECVYAVFSRNGGQQMGPVQEREPEGQEQQLPLRP